MGRARWLSWVLFALRVAMGAFFLKEAASQLQEGWIGGIGLAETLQRSLDENTIAGPYRWFLEHVALEYDQLFTWATIAGELAVGAGLVLGLLTRLTALVAAFMNLNFMLMNGPEGGALDALFVILELLLVAAASRQALSADGVLARAGLDARYMSAPLRRRST